MNGVQLPIYCAALHCLVASGDDKVQHSQTEPLPPFAKTIEAIYTGRVASPHGLLIFQRGEILLERYWPGEDGWRGVRDFGPDDLHDLRSCSKSVTGLLVGIATDQGLLPDLDTKAHTLFPDLNGDSLRRPTSAHHI